MQRTQKFTNSSDSVIKIMGRFSKLSRLLNITKEGSTGQKSRRGLDPSACVEQNGNVERGTEGSALIYQSTNHKTASSEV